MKINVKEVKYKSLEIKRKKEVRLKNGFANSMKSFF